MPLPALHSQPVPAAAKTAPAPELSLRGGRRPTWRPEREARGSALGVQSREGTAVPYRPPLKWQTPKYGVQRRSLRSRWRLCRLTDAASPLRGASALYRDIQPRKCSGAPPHSPTVSLRGPEGAVAISGRQLRFRRGFPVIQPGTARFPRRFAPRNDTSGGCSGAPERLLG